MQRDRDVLEKILKAWAQDHDHGFVIADPSPGDDGVTNTGGYLSWLIKSNGATLDLLGLLDRLELYMDRVNGGRKPDGMFCQKCQNFYQYAGPNQSDGSLICYTCRNNPYT